MAAFGNVNANGGDLYNVNGGHGGGGDTQKDASGNGSGSSAAADSSSAADRNAASSSSTFGFHNWLLQPYEGGADGLGQFSMSTGNNGFGAAPKTERPTVDCALQAEKVRLIDQR